MVENLISFSLATMALAISPGPDNIYVLTQSLVNGPRSGLATTAGLISGCIVHTTLLAFGLSLIITSSPALFYGIKLLGACYLLYLAWGVYRTSPDILLDPGSARRKSHRALFRQGVFMNLVNPKVMIFFLAFFPGFLWNEHGNTVLQFYVLGATFMLVSFLIFGGIALLAGSISDLLSANRRVAVFLKWLQIVVFVGIAVFIILP